jgi:hypothetical protein
MKRSKLTTRLKAILRDPMWQTFGVLLAFLVLFIPLMIAYFNSSNPHFNTNRIVVSNKTAKDLTDIPEAIKNRMQVLIDRKEEYDLHFITEQIQNKGNQPIRSSDFETPLRGSVPTNRKLFVVQKSTTAEGPLVFDKDTGTVEHENRPQIDFEIKLLDEHTFEIKPVLMNPGEWMTVEIYTVAAHDVTKGSSETKQPPSVSPYSEVKWSCHVAGAICPDKIDIDFDYGSLGVSKYSFLHVSVEHEGWSVYFVLLFSVLSILSHFTLAKAARLQNSTFAVQLILLSLAIILSIASADVAADWLYPRLFEGYIDQPIYAWILFWLNVAAIIALTVIAIVKRKSRKSRVRVSSTAPKEEA